MTKTQKKVLEKPKPRRISQKKEIEYLRKHIPLFNIMRDMSAEQCESLMPFIKTQTHDAICTCIYNAITNFRKMPEDNVKPLREALLPKLNNYRYLSKRKNVTSKRGLKKRETLLEQSGGGLPFILASVLPLLGSLLGGI